MAGTFSNILLHFVFSTKGREPWIAPEMRDRLHAYIGGIIRAERGSLLSAGGVADHLHLLVKWRTDGTTADLMRNVKARSSSWIHETYENLDHFAWQEGYGVFSVSESMKPAVMAYLAAQEEHHRTRSFKEEFIDFLIKNGIEYDERYIWD